MDDPIRTEMMKHRLVSVAEEMGARLQRAAFSPNIKERCDFSCAVFDASGNLVAQAAHIPVHLGAMPLSVQACLESLTLAPGDVAMVNDPYRGGTHLPDLTVVSPVFVEDTSPPTLLGLVANRAHHADIGGMSAGSMPLSQEIFQEGLIIPPVKLMVGDKKNDDIWRMLLANVRTPEERMGDLQAQLAANQIGGERMRVMAERFGVQPLLVEMDALLRYSERMTRQLISTLPNGCYRFEDALDNDGFTEKPADIRVAIMIEDEEVTVDFSGTDAQRPGSINAVYPVTLSAVAYVFRCVLGLDIPANSGCLRPIQIIAPAGTLVNARPPAAVAAGNVETSQRIVDVLLGALAQACPDRIPAASQGTMNNLTIGGWDQRHNRPFAYYETIGGGMGAGPQFDGASGRHSHMTNTLNTPVEAVEYAYPFRVSRYALREGSGGNGQHQGGDGIVRTYEFLQPAEVTLLSDRRITKPYGLEGGAPGKSGCNSLRQNETEKNVSGKCSFSVEAGNELTIETPGGGGYGIK
ncbi:hydantoinase B/oxoprolinase family protein [Candidatus Nitrospira allomarina]|uniref:Hydantoinase B/oxoprolinase family protein n=1 Tax=Candidatus Nitrospira allomarina TaxID=3020900 RepID=A0AA96JSG9_9BACT|nr:hydantoinase B/oxoprolinase family protein [Candidatus Nitrospira allomarina]WNM58557.1 hydantoinase B/oxoprolinase family protein [Candidatus Nitrospira allomarina]